jgi:hypothetical protein
MKPNSNQMNKLGQQIFRAFAAGSVEELAAALEVIIRENSAPVECGALPEVRKLTLVKRSVFDHVIV